MREKGLSGLLWRGLTYVIFEGGTFEGVIVIVMFEGVTLEGVIVVVMLRVYFACCVLRGRDCCLRPRLSALPPTRPPGARRPTRQTENDSDHDGIHHTTVSSDDNKLITIAMIVVIMMMIIIIIIIIAADAVDRPRSARLRGSWKTGFLEYILP